MQKKCNPPLPVRFIMYVQEIQSAQPNDGTMKLKKYQLKKALKVLDE